MNPFITIWFSPKRTIRAIVDQNPKFLVLFLALMAGAVEVGMQGVTLASQFNAPLLWTVIFSAVIGGVLGLIGLYFFGFLYRWIGSWFGGKATGAEARAAVAWAKVPTFVIFGIWLLIYFLAGDVLGALSRAPEQLSGGTVALVLGYVAAGFWFGTWSFVMLCLMLGEVHGFSGWKGLLIVLIQSVLLIPVVFVIGLLAATAIPNFLRARETVLMQQLGQRPAHRQEGETTREMTELDESLKKLREQLAEFEPQPMTDEPEAQVPGATAPTVAGESLPPFELPPAETVEEEMWGPIAEEPMTEAPPMPVAEEPAIGEPQTQIPAASAPTAPPELLRSFRLTSGETFEGRVVFDGDTYFRVELADGTERIIFKDEIVE